MVDLAPSDIRVEARILKSGLLGIELTYIPNGFKIECDSERNSHTNRSKAFELLTVAAAQWKRYEIYYSGFPFQPIKTDIILASSKAEAKLLFVKMYGVIVHRVEEVE